MLHSLDLLVFVVYVAAVVGFGAWFMKTNKTSESFMTAAGGVPSWAVALSIFGTFLSSNTFLGVPGKAFGADWNSFVFSLSLPVAAIIAAKFFVPFYRKSGAISAYEHLEERFGRWARVYAVICYLLTQVARTGAILFGVGIGLEALTGWPLPLIILVTGVLVTGYTLAGGIEAVIWTDVVQSIVLLLGALMIVGMLLFGHPEGAGAAVSQAYGAGKFSLGDFGASLTSSTFWVVLVYGLFMNLNNFGIDQSYVQRYHAARSESGAARSVLSGAWLYLPVSALFFLIGSLLFSYYHAQPELLEAVKQTAVAADGGAISALKPADYGDKVLPHFISTQVPVGVRGLIIAAIFAAAMSSVDTSLNSAATVTLKDLFRGAVNEKTAMRVLRGSTMVWGVVGTGVALAMMGQKSLLDAWWKLSGVFAGGMLGLFLLGILVRKADHVAAKLGVAIGLIVIVWMTFPESGWMPEALRSPFHANMIIVFGTLSIFLVGLLFSRLTNNDRGGSR
jgi:solute:Na+ symporter, SSS family